MYNNLLVERKGMIEIITINRPSQLNALNKETIQELNAALTAANDDKNVGVIILTGSGEKAFVAGADIKEFAHFSIAEGGKLAASVFFFDLGITDSITDKHRTYTPNFTIPVK